MSSLSMLRFRKLDESAPSHCKGTSECLQLDQDTRGKVLHPIYPAANAAAGGSNVRRVHAR